MKILVTLLPYMIGDIFDISEPLPSEFTISVSDTESALQKVKLNKATGPDNIPPWVLKDFFHQLTAPITAIFNSSLREGIVCPGCGNQQRSSRLPNYIHLDQ